MRFARQRNGRGNPVRRNRTEPPVYDEYLYRSRHLIENALLGSNPRAGSATRDEQTTASYAAFVALACVCLWLM